MEVPGTDIKVSLKQVRDPVDEIGIPTVRRFLSLPLSLFLPSGLITVIYASAPDRRAK